MYRSLFIALSLLAASSLTHAGSSSLNPGSSLTTGAASNPLSIYGAHANPAAGDTMVAPDEELRVNYLPSVTAGAEVGPVDNFVDDIDALVDLLDNPAGNEEPVQVTVDRFNDTLETIGEDGYTKLDAIVYAPLLPLHWRPEGLKGTLSAGLSLTTQARLSVLDDELVFDRDSQSFSTGSAAYLKSGLQTAFSLGYSAPLFEASEEGDAQLYLGARLNLYKIDLSKQVYLLQLLNGRDVDELVRDEYNQDKKSSLGVGLDLGLLWKSGRYTTGLTLANINEPSFEFGTVGVGCGTHAESSDERSNCEAASAFTNAGAIEANEVHTKHAVATLENSVALRDNWTVFSSLDLTNYQDMAGDKYQWMSVSTAYQPKGALPDLRVGFRHNLAGSELSSVTAGLSFGNFSLDLEWGLDTVAIDDQSMPRRFSFALSFEERF